MSARDDILDDELLRPTPGLRPFSVGILRLCRKLKFAVATDPKKDATAPPPALAGREDLAIAWMLDAAQSVEQIKAVVFGSPEIFAGILDEYEFDLEPAFLVRVKAEIARTQRAIQEAAFEIEPKPGGAQGPSPQGK